MSFKGKAQKDSKYLRLMKIVNSIESRIDASALIKEMQNMLLVRKYRKTDHIVLIKAGNDLAEWASELNSHRSRLADIRFLVLDQKLRLEAANKSVHKYLGSKYREDMKSIKGVNERKSYIEDVLEEPLLLIGKLDRLLKLSEEVSNELEASFKNNTLIKNIMEIVTRPDRV